MEGRNKGRAEENRTGICQQHLIWPKCHLSYAPANYPTSMCTDSYKYTTIMTDSKPWFS